MKIRYLKVLRDLTSDYARTAMLVLAIAIGVLGVGTILGGYAVITREMTTNYSSTLPASATLELNEPISRELVDSVRRLPNLQTADRRATLSAQMQVQGKWYPLLLFVVDDFRTRRISTFRHLSGATEPPLGTMLVERTAFDVMKAQEGGNLLVKTMNGSPKTIRLMGTVHDPSLAPAYQEQSGYGYISGTTLRWLGETQGFDQLKIRVATGGNSMDSITTQAKTLAAWLERRGHRVHDIQVPPPNQHPHQSQMNAVLTIFVVFSFLILILGSLLVATSLATLMVKQVRQIGVMKTIGASSGQIAQLYVVMVLLVCLVALVVGIPVGRVGASMLYSSVAALLNLTLTDSSIPAWVTLVQIGAGILIPLLAVAGPVRRGSRLSVRQALDTYGVSTARPIQSAWVARLSRVNGLSTTVGLALRNAFRQQSRLVMTLGLLAAGGAMFMTALNVSDAWDNSLNRIYAQRLYDLEIRLGESVPSNASMAKLKAIPGLTGLERGSYASAALPRPARAPDDAYDVKHTYPDKGHGGFTIQAMSLPTRMTKPTVVAGRWLDRPGATDIVLNQSARRPGMKPGDTVRLSVNRQATTWHIVGFVEEIGSPATAYVSAAVFDRQIASADRTTYLRFAFADRSKGYVVDKTRGVETLLAREGIAVQSSRPTWLLQTAIGSHMRILVNALLAMAMLMALVGTLGLLSTMSMNVLERTREMGVMRAIGATPQTIRTLIVWEGLIIGALSIGLAFVLSLGLSLYLGRFIGNMAFRTPLSLSISPLGGAIWIAIIVVGSYLATLFPARRASRLTTREALAYA